MSWYRESVNLRVRADGVPGHRALGEVFVREASDGSVLLIPAADLEGDALTIVQSGRGRISARDRDVAKLQASIAKSAYLTACAFLGEVPTSPRAEALRAELIVARGAPRDQPLPVGPISRGLLVFRGPLEPETGDLTLVHFPHLAPRDWWIGWNNSAFIEWPLERELLEPLISELELEEPEADDET